jgi:hypothetical protein
MSKTNEIERFRFVSRAIGNHVPGLKELVAPWAGLPVGTLVQPQSEGADVKRVLVQPVGEPHYAMTVRVHADGSFSRETFAL